ncbi:7-methylguanosine phosphate-specific 5'-nucleotidase A isoform X1 [Neltuma alba]|uniref:7-methylguanosine phosphate-specific 5'-nucleotidase A isoform X1 n=2 Tax=Neltuma alba TaxID=207710 RepID=UPI0010A311AB|nr:7-methylguanosine phosphate-specific 5'-nucleotidase A-like isoform X1 [Prosopis alba]
MSYRVNGLTSIPLSAFRKPHFRRYFRFWKHLEMEESVANKDPELIVGDPDSLANKISAIRSAGPQKLQVIADFDATLTKFWANGTRGQSSHGLVQQGNPEYDAKRQQLYDYYHPLEFSPDIGLEEKTKLMEEWWSKTHALLIEGGLTNESIKQSVANGNIAFREGVFELFEFLEEKGIPVLIFSAGLGDIIEEVLRQKLHRTFTNVRIVSNRMVFDEDGHLVSFKGKLIHSLNKNEHALDMGAPVHNHLGDEGDPNEDNASIKYRTNVLLLGDHIGDLRMSDGLNYETRISVGFLNHNIENSLNCYRESFDVVLLNDAPMTEVVKLVSSMCPKE